MTVYSLASTSVLVDGTLVPLTYAEPWDENAAVVRQHPEYFADTPPAHMTFDGANKRLVEAPVETASQRPGEKRNTRRPR